tara:strand:+ start:2100 stop:2300 length:201 start_codon:yes stop_codon:yes gene_type:complete
MIPGGPGGFSGSSAATSTAQFGDSDFGGSGSTGINFGTTSGGSNNTPLIVGGALAAVVVLALILKR